MFSRRGYQMRSLSYYISRTAFGIDDIFLAPPTVFSGGWVYDAPNRQRRNSGHWRFGAKIRRPHTPKPACWDYERARYTVLARRADFPTLIKAGRPFPPSRSISPPAPASVKFE